MKVILCAGGTGGHIYPCLAIMNKIKEKEPKSEFLYIGTTDRMEATLIPSMNIPFKGIEMKGLDRHNLFNNFKVTGKVVSISVASNGEYLFKVKIKNGKTYDIGSNMHNLSFEI